MTCLGLEGTIVCPQINRIRDAGHSALIDQLCGLSTSNGELEVGILLPVAEE